MLMSCRQHRHLSQSRVLIEAWIYTYKETEESLIHDVPSLVLMPAMPHCVVQIQIDTCLGLAAFSRLKGLGNAVGRTNGDGESRSRYRSGGNRGEEHLHRTM